jgi:rhomboid domain-containing protein 1
MDFNLINFLMVLLVGVFVVQGQIGEIWARSENGLGTQFLRTLAHGDLLHLLSNLFGLWKIRELSTSFTWWQSLIMIIFIWVASTVGLFGIKMIGGTSGDRRITIGFSGVLFGLFVVYYYLQSNNIMGVLFTLFQGILPHLLVPGISFEGHLAGILAGWLYVTLFL